MADIVIYRVDQKTQTWYPIGYKDVNGDGSVYALKMDNLSQVSASVSVTDKSGMIAVANTSQLVAAANTSRKAFWLQNTSDVDMWVQLGAAAVVGEGFFVAANGGTLQFEGVAVPTNAIYVICASAGEAFAAYEG